MVKVESIKSIEGAGNLKGFAVVNISDRIRISDVRIIQQDGQRPWVSMPSRAYEKDGQRKWAPTIELLDEGLKKQISEAVLAEFAKSVSTAPATRQLAGW